MFCPNCSQQMIVRNVDNEIVLHCATCGSSFFEKNGIDRISTPSARSLAEEIQGQYILGNQKHCPKDKSILLEKVDPKIPKNTVLLECPSCEGVFAYSDDLLKYKGIRAPQPLRASAFNLLPAPKTFLMLATFAVLSLGVLISYPKLSEFSPASRAEKIVNTMHMNVSGRYFLISFTTNVSDTTSIQFYDKDMKKTVEHMVSETPKKVHTVTLTDFDKTRDVYYSIILSETSTKPEKVVISSE